MKLNLSAEEVKVLMTRATFADLLQLAENFWDMPQETRLHVLYCTSVDPFVLTNSFARFFWAFGFGDYFAEYADVKDMALRKQLVDAKFAVLMKRMESELREIVSVVRNELRGGSLCDTFVKNVENMMFMTPISLPGYSDYNEVQRVVRAMAFEMAHPDLAAKLAELLSEGQSRLAIRRELSSGLKPRRSESSAAGFDECPAFLGGGVEQVERGVAALSVGETTPKMDDVLASEAFGHCEGHGHGSLCCDVNHS